MIRAYDIELHAFLIEKCIADVGISTLCFTSCRLMTFLFN